MAVVVVGGAYAGGYWCFFRSGPTYEIGGVSHSLDIERAVVRAKWQHRPVLLYFTGETCVNARKMECDVLRAPTVVRRLGEFVCAAIFTDRVPFVDEKEGKRLGDANQRLQERLLGEVALPAFAVVDPEFDPADPSGRHLRAVSIGILGEAELEQFLNSALAEWNDRRQSTMLCRDE